MIAPLVIADLSATTVLPIIHWIGVGFIFLWFLGSCMKDGMWNNGLRCFNAAVAAIAGLPVAILAAGLIGGAMGGSSDPSDQYLSLATIIGANWIAFLVWAAILQTLTDRLSQVKVAFHPIVNSIGSFIFVCGITLILFIYCMPIYDVVRQIK